jgi:hypothetical protein
MKTKRSQKFAVETVDGLIDWHAQNVPDLNSYKGQGWKAACWWAASMEADELCEVNTVKDWARLIQAGTPGINSLLGLESWLKQYVLQIVVSYGSGTQTGETSQQYVRKEILTQLRGFWLGEEP